jgi:hypothetical protein
MASSYQKLFVDRRYVASRTRIATEPEATTQPPKTLPTRPHAAGDRRASRLPAIASSARTPLR